MYTHLLIEYLNKYDNIEEALSLINKNIVYKRHGHLIIFKYKDKYGSDLERSCRGLIYNINTKKIVCYSNTGTTDLESFSNEVPFANCVIEENLEGSLINLYYNNRWNVSTKFSINADESKFRSKKTFRQIFDYLFKIDKDILDKKYTYSFFIRIPENKLVTRIIDYDLYHIETHNNITGEKIYMDIGIKHPKILDVNIHSYKNLHDNLYDLDYENRGYMLYSRDRNLRCAVINPNYKKFLDIVEGHVDIKFILLRSSLYTYNIDILLDHFPEYNTILSELTNDIKLLQQHLYSDYVEIYCKKEKTLQDINTKYKKTLIETREMYKNTKKHDITFEIYPENVYDVLMQNECEYVYDVLYK